MSRVQTSECARRTAETASVRQLWFIQGSRVRAYIGLLGVRVGRGIGHKGGKLERYLCAESESSAHGHSSENVRHLCSEAFSKYG